MARTGEEQRIEKSLAVSRVEKEAIPYVWGALLPQVERALAHGDGDSTTAGNMLSDLMQGHHQLWAIHEGEDIIAGLVVSVHTYPAKTTVVVELAAGRDMDLWIGRIEKLLADYRDLVGADTIECSCRAGLARRLRSRGWKRKAEIMELSYG